MNTALSTVFLPLRAAFWRGHNTAMNDNARSIQAIADRIRARILELDTSPRAVSLKTGRGPDVVRNLLRAADDGKTYNPRADTIEDIAKALDLEPNWLRTGTGIKSLKDAMGELYPRVMRFPHHKENDLQYGGIVEAGAFRAVELFSQEEDKRIPIAPDPRFPKARQYAWEVRGDSMDKAGITEGMYVAGVNYMDFVEHYGDLSDGMLVVVERSRDDGAETELTVKEARRRRDGIELLPRSSNPVHKPFFIPRDHGPGIANPNRRHCHGRASHF